MCGLAHAPKNLDGRISQALGGIAGRASVLLSKDSLPVSGTVAKHIWRGSPLPHQRKDMCMEGSCTTSPPPSRKKSENWVRPHLSTERFFRLQYLCGLMRAATRRPRIPSSHEGQAAVDMTIGIERQCEHEYFEQAKESMGCGVVPCLRCRRSVPGRKIS